MYSIRETIKNKKGFTLVEVTVTLSLIALTLSLLVPILSVHLSTYYDFSNYNKSTIEIKEALSLIENEISKDGEIISVVTNGVEIQKRNIYFDENKRKIKYETIFKIIKQGSTLYIQFKEGVNNFVSQPLLYEVEAFNIEENAGVIFMKIKTKDGISYEKTFDKGL
ncbi:prepilin-type N-terminal cleavage/methylation domain-containing protein [Clostridium punense]|uniref:Prepilin-type N-terminal cleavage/methylation domain-containing protein n=1 Tax=Clostridium punense TaxID=1054297 RepID=A0ABS4K1U2_9CLOT|nr:MULTISPECIES: type II secretion system protein [Clostridium]EQB89234.1 hypothetical protein M918_21275 [Clostridium sp. BL8]MBP2021742.1 prepilin-type N-terminal cleavage/methylation domain-containing protein [Clostridium punense]